MLKGFATPGSRSSQIIMAVANGPTHGTANKLGVASAVSYVISRGLAKYEGRGTLPPNTPPQ
jgi:hypothetical protein